jgi:hypothetical protein
MAAILGIINAPAVMVLAESVMWGVEQSINDRLYQ